MNIGDVGQFVSDIRQRGRSGQMTDYQQEALYQQRYDREYREAIAQISGMLIQSNQIEMDESPKAAQAYRNQYKGIIEQFAPYMLDDAGNVMSNTAAVIKQSTKLKRLVDDTTNEIQLITNKRRRIEEDAKLGVREQQQQLGTLDEKMRIAMDISTGEIASGAQQLQILTNSADKEETIHVNRIIALQSIGRPLNDDEKKELQSRQGHLNRLSGAKRAAHEMFGAGMPKAPIDEGLRARALKVGLPENASETAIKIAEDLVTSKSEKGDRKAMPIRAPHEQGIAMRRALGKGISKAVELPSRAATRTIENIAAIPDALLGLVGLPKLPTPAGATDALSQMLYKLLYKGGAKPSTDIERPTNISEKLLSGVR